MMMKRLSKVNLIRSNISSNLAASLPSFIFYNVGTVHAVKGQRVCVAWAGSGYLWFDAEALELAA
jgi:hypothetical protein